MWLMPIFFIRTIYNWKDTFKKVTLKSYIGVEWSSETSQPSYYDMRSKLVLIWKSSVKNLVITDKKVVETCEYDLASNISFWVS
jgi:hypothetical protein